MGALAITSFFAPSIANHYAPGSLKILGLDEDQAAEKKLSLSGCIAESGKIWWKVFKGESFSGGMGGVVTGFAAGVSVVSVK